MASMAMVMVMVPGFVETVMVMVPEFVIMFDMLKGGGGKVIHSSIISFAMFRSATISGQEVTGGCPRDGDGDGYGSGDGDGDNDGDYSDTGDGDWTGVIR